MADIPTGADDDSQGPFSAQARVAFSIMFLTFVAIGMAFSSLASNSHYKERQHVAEEKYRNLEQIKGRLAAYLSRSPSFFSALLWDATTGWNAPCTVPGGNGPCPPPPFVAELRTNSDGHAGLSSAPSEKDMDLAQKQWKVLETVRNDLANELSAKGQITKEAFEAAVKKSAAETILGNADANFLHAILAIRRDVPWAHGPDWVVRDGVMFVSQSNATFGPFGYSTAAGDQTSIAPLDFEDELHLANRLRGLKPEDATSIVDGEWNAAYHAARQLPSYGAVSFLGAELGLNRLEHVVVTLVAATGLFLTWAAYVLSDGHHKPRTPVAEHIFPHFGRYTAAGMRRRDDPLANAVRALIWWAFVSLPTVFLSYGAVLRFSGLPEYNSQTPLERIWQWRTPDAFSLFMDLVIELSLIAWVSILFLLESRFCERRTSVRLVIFALPALFAAAGAYVRTLLAPGYVVSNVAVVAGVQAIFIATWAVCVLCAARRGLVGLVVLGTAILAMYSFLAI
jgi:hypothetical protein